MTAQPQSASPTPLMTQVGEAELVTAARARDEAAMRELIRRYNPRLFRVSRGMLPSDADAEEIVQETWLTAFSRLDTLRSEARFSTWITRIALNNARMRLRAARATEEYDTVNEVSKLQPTILAFSGATAERPEVALGRRELRDLLESAVADLPSSLRLVFLLRESEGMSMREIARDLSLNPVAVKTRLFRARRHLRTLLEKRLRGGFDEVFPFDGIRCTTMADRVIAALCGRAEPRS